MVLVDDILSYHFDFHGVVDFVFDVDFRTGHLVTKYDYYFDIDTTVDAQFLWDLARMIDRAEIWYWSPRVPDGKGLDELPWHSKLVLREQTYEIDGLGDHNSGFTDFLENLMDLGRAFIL
ncbi:MAG: hypothetical protein MJZ38_00745 [archaeon]|nr:hypothetical protein [archaeon]